MKKTIICLLLIAAGLTIRATGHKHGIRSAADDYRCPLCLWTSLVPGRCQTHNTELIPDGTYYCKTDIIVRSSSPGKCTRCGNMLVRMDAQQAAPGDMIVMAQDTTKRTEQHTGKAVRDPELEEQMNNDPDNRDRSMPKTVIERDSSNVPE